MKMSKRLGSVVLLAAAIVLSAAWFQSKPSRYIYLWAGNAGKDHMGSDVIAVVDADPSSASYAKVIDVLTVDGMGGMPHHSEFDTPVNASSIFVNDYHMSKSYMIDFKNPAKPVSAGEVALTPGAHTPHSFARLANGHVLATIQFGDDKLPGRPGGVAEFDANGKFIRYSSSRDDNFHDKRIRTYALATLPKIDRLVTTSSAMDTEAVANTVQVWRLSDLKLLKTLEVENNGVDSAWKYPFEVRAMPDGKTALVNTYYCSFYQLTDLAGDPKITPVMKMDFPKNIGCSVPTISGNYMVMPIAYAHRYATIDISDPSHPREVASLATDTTFYPHWISRDPLSDRVVVTDQGDGPPFVMLGHFDSKTGKLWWDEKFKDAGASRPGLSFANVSWPNGMKGSVKPHGALFVR